MMYCVKQFKNTLVYYAVRLFTVIVMKSGQRILSPIRCIICVSYSIYDLIIE